MARGATDSSGNSRTSGGYQNNRPSSEDRKRRFHIGEKAEKDEHDTLRACLGHDDLPREDKCSNLAHIQPYTTVQPIRQHKPMDRRRQETVQDGDVN